MAIEFSSDFETGNGELVNLDGDEVVFRAVSKRGSAVLWWHFELRDVGKRRLRVTMDNAAEVLCGLQSLAAARPVVNLGGKDWHRLPPGHVDEAARAWSFEVEFPCQADRARLAFCYPYGYSEAMRVARGWHKASAASLEVLATSPGGRRVPVLLLGKADQPGRELVVVAARQHAGETPGSFVLEGFVEAFLARGACSRWLSERGLVVVLPAMDPDGMAEGNYGKLQEPLDPNRDWAGDSYWPQVRAARELIADLAHRHQYRLFLDFHAPCAHNPAHAFLSPEDMIPPQAARGQQRVVELLAERPSHWFDFYAEDSSVAERAEGLSQIAQAREHGCTAVCLETPYNQTRDGREGSPLRYRQHGAAVATAAVTFVSETASS